MISVQPGNSHFSSDRRTALIYDRLDGYGGAERVLENMIDLYPRATVYASIDILKDHERAFLRGKTPVTTFAQRWIDKAQGGWYFQNNAGAWTRK